MKKLLIPKINLINKFQNKNNSMTFLTKAN